jgi:hypothetical protein
MPRKDPGRSGDKVTGFAPAARCAPWLALATAAALTALSTALPAHAGDFSLHLDYAGRFSIFGKVLDAKVDESAGEGTFESGARLHSAGLLAIFKRIEERANATGRIVGGEARPSTFRYDNPGAKKYRKVEVAWSDHDVTTTSSVPIKNWGYPPATTAQKLEAADPLTQVMRFALASAGPACTGSTSFFDGKQLYALDFVGRKTVGRSDLDKRLGLIDPVRCEVRYREVAGFKKKSPEKRDQGLTSPVALTFARVGATGPWVISTMDADTRWGHASVELETISTGG